MEPRRGRDGLAERGLAEGAASAPRRLPAGAGLFLAPGQLAMRAAPVSVQNRQEVYREGEHQLKSAEGVYRELKPCCGDCTGFCALDTDCWRHFVCCEGECECCCCFQQCSGFFFLNAAAASSSAAAFFSVRLLLPAVQRLFLFKL